MNQKILFTLPLTFGVAMSQAAEAQKPNIILIMADDLGYGDISCFGSETINTPNLDKMASEGIKFTDFHSNGVVSSPTRAALMTGCYQQRTGINGVINAKKHRSNKGLSVEELTVADKLKQMGYTTALTGKWHLGYDPKFNPTKNGFDYFRGFIAGNIDYQSYVDQAGFYDWWHNDTINREEKKGYLTDMITKSSIDFIKDNNPKTTGKPFFLYVAHATPHYPYQGREDMAVRSEGSGKYIRNVAKEDIPRIYKEITEVMDEGIGQLLKTLKDMNLDDNTIVIFCSDNGPVSNNGSTGGYRGHKTTVYEGGHRLPAIIRYPTKIEAGRVSDETILGMDFFPTFVDMAGGTISGLDGVSIKSHLEQGKPLASRYTFWGYANRVAMRDGSWKLIELRKDDTVTHELYDLSKDPFETTDLSKKESKRVEKMSAEIAKWREDVTPKKVN